MFKRVLLGFTFVAALGAAGLGLSTKALAWNDCNTGYGYTTAYPYTTAAYPYATSYPYSNVVSYGPRVVYAPSVPVRTYPVFYGHDRHHHNDHHDHHHNGLTISFGF